ncbi:alpha/beta hydrolase [Saccharibacillus sp. VR-M41]|uniref:Alpha/beta hydrolase n=1 Tax=Saccharibacillus alkalitolerans TaxID=2705290 RepID=A0ABX0F5W0_9BACL|nr:alpha/beta hydrolase [Saccharibacillus alkalitolerans]
MKKRNRTLPHRLVTFFIRTLLILLALLLAGFVYQWFGERSDREAYIAPGQRVEVNGHKMHVYHEEKPGKAADEATVVLIAGWGTPNPYANFSPIYDKLRGRVSFAVVERFGYGYSEVTDDKREIDAMTEELHEALEKAGVRPPYVLAPHSLGVLEAIRFSKFHPDEVKGLVMIDTGSPEFYETFPSQALQSRLQRIAIKSGIVRALYHVPGFAERVAAGRNGLKLLTPEMKKQDRLATLLVANNKNVTDEMREMHANARKVVQDKEKLNIPMTVLVADHLGRTSEERMDAQRQFAETWSNDSQVVLVRGSGHSMQAYQPQAIADALIERVEKTR